MVAFSNGTRKLVLPPLPGSEAYGKATATTLIAFVNGDFKHQLPGGTTEYFYAEVCSAHARRNLPAALYFLCVVSLTRTQAGRNTHTHTRLLTNNRWALGI